MSIHTDRAWRKLRESGALAGNLAPGEWKTLSGLSKRELIEIAMRLGALCTDHCDDSRLAYLRVIAERDALRDARII